MSFVQRLLHRLGFHDWKVVRMSQYLDTSFGDDVPSTRLYLRCACGAYKKDIRYGERWDRSDFPELEDAA